MADRVGQMRGQEIKRQVVGLLELKYF